MRHTVYVQVELDAESDAIRGSAHDNAGDAFAFDGWLELIALLEQFRNRHLATSDPQTRGGRS